MKRTTIYLTDDQVRRLDALAEKTELKVAEMIRRAIDEYVERAEKKARKEKDRETE